ncbi:hypothetical protein [Anaerobaca lacustris]|uniref:Uncharacterized protein n=1 Tax=Anaerobaca lacustris TaxID=3044600 RepID=A0AAW6U0D7_9BACT|nr:hypothetical protein [Sedimentisphaerales bacterium M17dextr]
MTGRVGHTIPRYYYLLTPAFILLDYVVGINIRVAVLDATPVYKNLYYGFCVLCGVVVLVLPRASAVVAFVESTILIFLTVPGVFRPLVENVERFADLNADWQMAGALPLEGMLNLLMAAAIAVLAFHLSLSALANRGGPAGRCAE